MFKQTSKAIHITTSFVGFHRWPEAPPSVAYLARPHRHLFKVIVECELKEDRQIEFHILKGWVDELVKGLPTWGPLPPDQDCSIWSCEKMAEFLAEEILNIERNTNYISVTVSEDGECGATICLERT